MLPRLPPLAVLTLSWLLAALAGGLIEHHLHASSDRGQELTLRHLQIVGDDGQPRIVLGVQKNEPVSTALSSAQQTIFRLNVETGPDLIHNTTLSVPQLRLNDSHGDDAIQMFAYPGQRGLLAFSSTSLPEGRLLLGRFGLTDDGSDTAVWGLQVSSSIGGHTGRLIGVQSIDDRDTHFIWPELRTRLGP